MASLKQQSGNTLLGFIIGVVVGLGSALVVAVYVTKVPVPFLNKGQSRSAEQDAAETQKNNGWNPNAGLAGKNAATLPAASAAATVVGSPTKPDAKASEPAADKADKGAAKSDSKPDGKSEGKGELKPAVTADPLGDLAKTRTADVEPFTYFVQVGAFRNADDAEGQRARLSLAGAEAKVTEREQAGHTVYRVRVGPFDKKAEADKLKERLESAGYQTQLVRVQR